MLPKLLCIHLYEYALCFPENRKLTVYDEWLKLDVT